VLHIEVCALLSVIPVVNCCVQLGADDAWLCPHCRKYQQDTVKALSLWSFPEVLIIQLKRFKHVSKRRLKLHLFRFIFQYDFSVVLQCLLPLRPLKIEQLRERNE